MQRRKIVETYLRRKPSNPDVVSNADRQLPYLRVLLELVGNRDANILDAGCGSGRYARWLVEHGWRNVYGVDLFESIPVTRTFTYVNASVDHLPFRAQQFDAIYSFSVLYYLPDPADGIREFQRLLKSGGMLVLSAHTRYSFDTLWRIGKRSMGCAGVAHLAGVRFYSAGHFKSLLQQNGFEVLLVDGYFAAPYPLRLFRKLFAKWHRHAQIELPHEGDGRRVKIARALRSVFGYHSVLIARRR